MQRIWKEYFEDLYNTDTQEQVEFHMSGFDGIWRGTSEESQLEELRLRWEWASSRMGRLQVRMRSQEK